MMAAKALAIWAVILGLAVANGILREWVLVPGLGTAPGQLLSGVILSCLILMVTCWSLPWLKPQRSGQLAAIGFGWLVLTLLFEFSFGLLQGRSLPQILAAYTFEGGNIWPIVLLVTAFSPWLATRFREWCQG